MLGDSLIKCTAVGDARSTTSFEGARSHDGPKSALSGKRVVIVEDEGLTQMLLRKLVTQLGIQIVGSAVNGAQGVEMVLRERPDIVLMDINMPVMDGLEAGRRIMEHLPVCLIMLTAFADEDNVSRAEEIGASGYILKPVDRALLFPQLESSYQKYERERKRPLV